MAKQISSLIISLLFALTFKQILCQTKLFNGLQSTHGSLSFPSDAVQTLPVVSTNYSPRGIASSSSVGSKSGTQSTIVAIPLYIRNTSPSKAPMLFDILSTSLAENAAKSRKIVDSKPKAGTHSPSKQTSEVPKYHSFLTSPSPQRYQPQPQQSIKYSIQQEQNKSEPLKQEQPKHEDFSEYGPNGHSTPQKHPTHTSPTYYSSPQQSHTLQSGSKVIFPKSSVTQEVSQKQSYADLTSALNGYGVSKLTDTQTLYDASLALSQNHDSGSYTEKTPSKNTESSEYGSNDGSSSYVSANTGNRDPYSISNGLSYSASSISNPLYAISPNTGLSFGSRGPSFSNSGNEGLPYVPSYSSDGSNSDLVGSGSSGSLYSSANVGSTGISEDGNHASTMNSNYRPQSSISYGVMNNFDSQSGSSPVSGKPHRPLSGLYGQHGNGISYTLPISVSGYSSGSVNANPNNDNNNNNNQVLSSHGYNTQASNPLNTISSSVYNSNSQSVSSITFNPNFQSVSSAIYNPNSQLISSSIYNPSSQSSSQSFTSNIFNPSSQPISSSTYNPNSQLISSSIYSQKSQTISPNTYNPNSQSISTNTYNSNSQATSKPGSNGLYGSNSNDYSPLEEVDCYDENSSPPTDLTGSTISGESEKQATNSKTGIYTVPTETSGLASYEADDLDPSKLDLKIVHLPVSVLKRLVGNGELALPSFH